MHTHRVAIAPGFAMPTRCRDRPGRTASATIPAKIQLYRAAARHGLGYFAPCLAHQLVLEGEAAQARQRLGINVKRRHRVAEQKEQSNFRVTRSVKRESEGGSAASTPSRLACPRSQTNQPQGEGLLGGTRPRLKLQASTLSGSSGAVT